MSLADPPVISTVSFRKMASEEFQLLALIMARKMKTSETLLAFRLKNRSREWIEEQSLTQPWLSSVAPNEPTICCSQCKSDSLLSSREPRSQRRTAQVTGDAPGKAAEWGTHINNCGSPHFIVTKRPHSTFTFHLHFPPLCLCWRPSFSVWHF